jgi:hypothetical protein
MGDMYRKRYFKDSTFEALKIIEPVVEKHGLTMIETALRWVVNHSALSIMDGNDGVIIGCSSIAQLDENLADCKKGPLPAEVVEALDKAWSVTKADTPNYWRMEFGKLTVYIMTSGLIICRIRLRYKKGSLRQIIDMGRGEIDFTTATSKP